MPMDDERAAFLRRICESPGDDLPRLVFADWLDEQGEAERAEGIRWMLANPNNSWVCLCNLKGPGQICPICATVPGCSWIPKRNPALVFQESPYVVQRGFVSEVRLTLAAFVGGACPEIRHALAGGIDHGAHCLTCNGTGRIEGAAKLFRMFPIQRMVLTDREPTERSGLWYWFRADGEADAYRIRNALFQHLGPEPSTNWTAPYFTRQTALDALSAACVSYGRSLAFPAPVPAFGLPPHLIGEPDAYNHAAAAVRGEV